MNVPQNAASIRDSLSSRLRGLAHDFTEIAAVQIRGFFQGVAVWDPKTVDAAPSEARRIIDALARGGVLVGLPGSKHEIIKIWLPMVLDRGNADLLVATLARVLREGV